MVKLIAPVVAHGAMARTVQPTIDVDDEIALRPFGDDDADAVVRCFATPDIQFFHFRRFDDEGEAITWIGECAGGWRTEQSATWAVVQRTGGEVVGRVAMHTSLEDGYGEVSYFVLPTYRGRGVATRACKAATGWAHGLGLHRVQLQHPTRNAASRQVALRAGFREEGVRRGANLHADGWHDMVLWSHLATDQN